MSPLLRFARLCAASLVVLLAACTASQMQQMAGPADPVAHSTGTPVTTGPLTATPATGAIIVGLLTMDEPGNLSDGMVNSMALAGTMAAGALNTATVTLLVRPYDGKKASLEKIGKELILAGARLIIAPADDANTLALAKLTAGKSITVIGTSNLGDATQGVFTAGLSSAVETAAAVAEMSRRGYRGVAIAATKDAASKAYAAALAAAARSAGIITVEIDVTNTKDGISKLGALMRPDGAPQAFVFATGPVRAASVIAGLRGDPRFAGVAMVGNATWSISSHMLPPGGNIWFTALAGNNLAAFAQKFSTANGQQPTLAGAIIYDLVVLAGALPQIVPDDPYGEAVMTTADGFQGQTGSFRFDLTGKVQRDYAVVDLK